MVIGSESRGYTAGLAVMEELTKFPQVLTCVTLRMKLSRFWLHHVLELDALAPDKTDEREALTKLPLKAQRRTMQHQGN